MASGWYNSGLRDIADRTIDYAADTIKVMLVTSSYTPDPDHDFANDVDANEVSGTGYTGGFGGAGRKTLASKTFTTDTTNNFVKLSAAAVTWSAVNGFTPKYAVFLKEITNDAASRLLWYLDLGTVTLNGGDMTMTPDSTAGWVKQSA
jgi:hypothetical protein